MGDVLMLQEILNKEEKKEFSDAIDALARIFEPVNKQLCSNCTNFNNRTNRGCCEACGWNNAYFSEMEYNIQNSFKPVEPRKMKHPKKSKMWKQYHKDMVQWEFANSEFAKDIRANFQQKLKEIKEVFSFNKVTGFFDTGNMKCSLPRELRSLVCLKTTCQEMRKHISKEDLELMSIALKKVRDIRVKRYMLT